MPVTAPPTPEPRPAARPSAADQAPAARPISPELVRAVADRVYALLLADLQLENERCGLRRQVTPYRKGGR